jgi:hypothetical protein
MLTEKEFFSIKEAAEYLSKDCSNEYSASDIIYLGEIQQLPIGAYRTLNDEIVYLTASDISKFDPKKHTFKNTPDFSLVIGFNDPDDALAFDESQADIPISNAEHLETVENIGEFVVPRKHLDLFLKNLVGGNFLVAALSCYKKQKTRDLWRNRYLEYLELKKNNPKATLALLSIKTANALKAKDDKIGSKTIEKEISRILRKIPSPL